MALLILIVLVVIFVLFLHYCIYESRKGKIVNRLPGPPIFSILGNALQLKVTPHEFYKLLRKYRNDYYPVYRLWVLHTPVISICHPEDLEILFTSKNHINKQFGYLHFTPWLKTGLLTSLGDHWFHRRKILTPAFHFNILKELMKTIAKHADFYTKKIRSQGSELTVDLVPFCMKLTLNIICESSMGVAVDGEQDRESAIKYKKALDDMVHLIMYRNVRPYLKDWALPLVPSVHKRIKESVYEIDKFVNKIVEQRRQYHKDTNYEHLDKLQNNEENLDIGYDVTKKRLAMLDLLLAAERNNLIDHDGIKEEVSTFVFAGHDTTGIAICFTVLLFAEHQEAQKQAREEVEEILNQKDGILEFSDLKDLKYLERCIKESQRLFPSVPTIARYMTEDLQLKNCLAPKGSDVMVHIIDVHKNPEFWPDPEKFDPDRFLPDEVNKRHPFSYIPFSAGSRNCIGQRFAMMEMKSVMASILYNFHIEPTERLADIEIVADAITRPSRPVRAKFLRIDRPSNVNA